MDLKQHERESSVEELQSKLPNNNSRIYFFVIAIVALLATNVYFFIKFKTSGEKLYTVTLQRETLQSDLDRIEAELESVNIQEFSDAENMKDFDASARNTISTLRNQLDEHDLSENDISSLKTLVSKLKDDVSLYKTEATSMKIRNELLLQANDNLDDNLNETEDRFAKLQQKQNRLNEKVSRASALKVSNVHVTGVKHRRDDEVTPETRARRVDELRIVFSIADNGLAQVGDKEIFVRVINPDGNLIAKSEDIFYVHGEKLQYTFKEDIRFTNNGEEYDFPWSDEGSGFKKGAYTVLLYADNAVMGRANVVLK